MILIWSSSEASVEKSNAFVSFKLFFSNINHDKVFQKITRCDIRSSTIFQVSMFIIKMNYEMLFNFNCCLDFFLLLLIFLFNFLNLVEMKVEAAKLLLS